MNTDPHAIRARVDAVLAELPRIESDSGDSADETGVAGDTGTPDDTSTVDAAGRCLEDAHQILVDALESVEKG